jgi:hypothetical protein
MSLSQPKANFLFFSAVCSTAWSRCSGTARRRRWLIRLCAASVSLGGSNQVLTHTTLVLIFGLTLCAPSVKAVDVADHLGDGDRADHAQVLLLVILPAMTPAM